MTKSIKKNYLLNLLNTTSSLIYPVLTFPYASRIMQADGIGQVNFYQSIIQYITLITCLGIPMYAVREIARTRNTFEECNKTALEILSLHLLLTIAGYIFIGILCCSISKIQSNLPLFLILSLSLILTTIGCEWFYQGIEDFKYITIRGLIIKTLSAILLFSCIKSKEDILLYGGYCVIGVLGGNLFNFYRLRKILKFNNIDNLKPLRHLKPALRVFLLNLIISLYVNLNPIMIGFMASNENVGYYTAATKITQITLGISSALSLVMLPRLSNLIANKQFNEFNILANKAIQYTFAITLPLSIGIYFTAPHIITLFCGESYYESIKVLQIISPIIFFIGLSNVFGIQILYPQNLEKKVIISTGIGALMNLILNFILLKDLGHNGAAISTLIAEFSVTVIMLVIGWKQIPITFKNTSYINYFVGCIIMSIVIVTIMQNYETHNILMQLAIIVIGGGCSYIIFLAIRKDEIITNFTNLLKKTNNEKV